MKVTYIHTPARSAFRDYRLVVGAGKPYARRALSLAGDDSSSLHVWRDEYGTHAEFAYGGLCRVVHGRKEALDAVREFAQHLVTARGAEEAIDGWFARGARGEIALVLSPVKS